MSVLLSSVWVAWLEAVKNDKKIVQFCGKCYGLICQNYSNYFESWSWTPVGIDLAFGLWFLFRFIVKVVVKVL